MRQMSVMGLRCGWEQAGRLSPADASHLVGGGEGNLQCWYISVPSLVCLSMVTLRQRGRGWESWAGGNVPDRGGCARWASSGVALVRQFMCSDVWLDPAGLCQVCSVNGGPGSPARAAAHPKRVARQGQMCICSMLQGIDNARLLTVAKNQKWVVCAGKH